MPASQQEFVWEWLVGGGNRKSAGEGPYMCFDSFFKIFSTICVFFLVYYYCDGNGANVQRKSPSVC
jgi:hypothetical protein